MSDLSQEEIDAIVSVTLPVQGYDVREAKMEDGIEIVLLPLELKDESGESFYIQPFFTKEDAAVFAEAIQNKIKES